MSQFRTSIITTKERLSGVNGFLFETDCNCFDLEKDQNNMTLGPDLIQIYSGNYLFLFTKTFQPGYQYALDFLSRASRLVGYGINNDMKWLNEVGCNLNDPTDLSVYIQEKFALDDPISLKEAVNKIGRSPEYYVDTNDLALSNWSDPNLTDEQLAYAVGDVFDIHTINLYKTRDYWRSNL